MNLINVFINWYTVQVIFKSTLSHCIVYMEASLSEITENFILSLVYRRVDAVFLSQCVLNLQEEALKIRFVLLHHAIELIKPFKCIID